MDSFSLPILAQAASVKNGWDVGSFLQNSTITLQKWGGYFVTLLGVVLLLVGVVMVVKGIALHGKTQTNWIVAIAAILIGGALFTGGFSFVKGIASGGKATIEDLGGGQTIENTDSRLETK